MAVTWGLAGAAGRASRYRGVMSFHHPAGRGDVSAVLAAATTPAFLQNHFNLSSYLIGLPVIILVGEGWA